ncbi:MAG TPA: VacJ family lipoprotein [Steroidobacteraceae bacterium]|jgi:phospholipid-binding lipoprotein MlaA|nr:VacJ family lipoprotein [Steroidobacteraceae bacterium]
MRAVLLVGMAGVAMGGCASHNPSIRRLPAETPAADNAAAIQQAAEIAAASASFARALAPDTSQAVMQLTPADAPSMYSYDPWERLNRHIYRFNAQFDEAVFLPVADSYRRLPSPVRAGVHNFFDNLSEPKSVVNFALQLRPMFGLRSLGRFVINTTLGIGGLFDVAAHFKLRGYLTGFSATLSIWGMHPGPYMVIPILGPSTLRDSVGMLGDYAVSYAINVADLYRGDKTWALGTVDAIDLRANTDFRYYATGSPFEYETIRFLYVHRELIEDEALHARAPPQARDPGTPAGR